jgi:hypothetical protein
LDWVASMDRVVTGSGCICLGHWFLNCAREGHWDDILYSAPNPSRAQWQPD